MHQIIPPGRRAAVELTEAQLDEAADHSRRYRELHRITQLQLANLINARPADISAIENRYHERSSRVVAAILGLSLEH